MSIRRLFVIALVFIMSALPSMAAPTASPATYKTVTVNGLNIFYREAGPTNAPAILLLHGFPSSSRMFDTLMPLLADRYHLVAPDYPGFGNSEAPRRTSSPTPSMPSPTSSAPSPKPSISIATRSTCRTTADRSVTGSPSPIRSG